MSHLAKQEGMAPNVEGVSVCSIHPDYPGYYIASVSLYASKKILRFAEGVVLISSNAIAEPKLYSLERPTACVGR